MLSLLKRNVLGVLVGGAILGLALPAMAQQTGKPGKTPAAAQPEHKDPEKKDQPKHEEKGKAAKIGEAAPAFELKDTDGKTVKLSDYKGKIVVLDWFNPECPVCAMHYRGETIQKAAAKFKDKNVVFLAINSTGAGNPGNGVERNAEAKKEWKVGFPVLLDDSGKVGKSYGAKTTPHCFVIDSKGTLVYAGAIDNGSAGKIGTVNYVEKALEQVLKGETVSTPETKSYGCAVHYAKG
jgi:peroxiredoxin